MRNLILYPITKEEMAKCLEELAAQFASEQAVGDMRPLLLESAAANIRGISYELDYMGLPATIESQPGSE